MPSLTVRPDFVNANSQSSIHVMTSEFEDLLFVLTEAMSFGIPTVSFKTEVGPLEVIKDGITGRLISKGNLSAFATALNDLMTGKDLRMRLGGAAYAKSAFFDPEKIIKQWITLFEQSIALPDGVKIKASKASKI